MSYLNRMKPFRKVIKRVSWVLASVGLALTLIGHDYLSIIPFTVLLIAITIHGLTRPTGSE